MWSKYSMEFPTEYALKKYLDAHPKADKSLHRVVPSAKPKSAPEPEFPQDQVKRTLSRTKAKRDTYQSVNELFYSYKNDSKMWDRTPYQKKWEDSLSDLERAYINMYTDNWYRDMNAALRGGREFFNQKDRRTSYESVKFMTSKMTKALKRQKLPESIEVLRGFDVNAVPGLRPLLDQAISGDIKPTDIEWKDKGFVSTSIQSSIKFEVNIACRITLPEGTSGAYVWGMSANRSEEEFLLPPGCTFRVHKVEKIKNMIGKEKYHVECEVVSQK